MRFDLGFALHQKYTLNPLCQFLHQRTIRPSLIRPRSAEVRP